MKNTSRLYKTTPSLNIISALNEMIETGKNASVLLQLANNMKENKSLPNWAKATFTTSHFENLFSLPVKNFRKVVKDDSYSFIRTVANIELKGSVITADQAVKLKDVLKIQVFASNEFLNKILTRYENSLVTELDTNLDTITDTNIAPATNTDTKTADIKNSDVFLISEKIKDLSLDDALTLRQLLDAHIDALSQAEKVEKAA